MTLRQWVHLAPDALPVATSLPRMRQCYEQHLPLPPIENGRYIYDKAAILKLVDFVHVWAIEWGHCPKGTDYLIFDLEHQPLADQSAVSVLTPMFEAFRAHVPGLKIGVYGACDEAPSHPAYRPDRLHMHTAMCALMDFGVPNRYPNDVYVTEEPWAEWQRTPYEYKVIVEKACEYHRLTWGKRPMLLVAGWQQFWDSGRGPAPWEAVEAQREAARALCQGIVWWGNPNTDRQAKQAESFLNRIAGGIAVE